MTNEIGRYNAYKAAHHSGATKDPRAEAAMSAAKKEAPKLYQRIQRQEALMASQQLIIDAMFDDPTIIAMLDEMVKHVAGEKQSSFAKESLLLGIETGANKRDIRNAYRRKARKLHPDVGGDAEAFKTLYTAYRILLKEAKN